MCTRYSFRPVQQSTLRCTRNALPHSSWSSHIKHTLDLTRKICRFLLKRSGREKLENVVNCTIYLCNSDIFWSVSETCVENWLNLLNGMVLFDNRQTLRIVIISLMNNWNLSTISNKFREKQISRKVKRQKFSKW